MNFAKAKFTRLPFSAILVYNLSMLEIILFLVVVILFLQLAILIQIAQIKRKVHRPLSHRRRGLLDSLTGRR